MLAEIERELERARRARAQGNEGQARVCARRAAGIAVREYYRRRGQPLVTPSAYDLLQFLTQDEHVDERLRQKAALLTLRVTPQFTLPVEADLIAEAEALIQHLLGV